jgi:glycosyltransferase involved in cell wall biosynthesis
MDVLVSICLPTFNSRSYLPRRIESILSQTHTHWHVVNVDSGSTDGTVDLLRQAFPSEKISFYQHPRGLYQSWNFSVQKAPSDYIHMATADDYEHPNFYRSLLKVLLEEEADLVHCRCAVSGNQNEITREQVPGWHHPAMYRPGKNGKIHKPAEDFICSLLLNPSIGPLNCCLLNRRLFHSSGPWPDQFGGRGDWAWFLKATLASRICAMDDELAFWLRRAGQATSKYGTRTNALISINIMRTSIEFALREHSDRFTKKQADFLSSQLQKIQRLDPASVFFPLQYFFFNPDSFLHLLTKRITPGWQPFFFRQRALRSLMIA